jgi:hypothetical protein
MSSLQFNGATYVRYDAAALTAVPLTMACWYKPVSTATGSGLIGLFNSGSASTNFFRLSTNTSGQAAAQTNASSTAQAVTSVAATSGQWSHFGATFPSNGVRNAFINGRNRIQDTASQTPTGLNRTSLGVRDSGTQSAFADGLMLAAGIWNEALNDEEMASLADGWSPLQVRRHALVFFVPCIAGTGYEMFGRVPSVVTATAADDAPLMTLQ